MRRRFARRAVAAIAALVLLGAAGPGCGDRPAGGGAGALVVETRSGPVRGALGSGARRFLGIPYAAAPVGDRRWRPPVPPPPWAGERDATTLGTACPATIPVVNAVVGGDEDCLTLNVVGPAGPRGPTPVLVWLHGGGFTSRDGFFARVTLGERLAAEHGLTVVTLNYRLGPLGFLAHPALAAEDPDHPSSGNYGIEDQIAALEWVRDNVGAFGGDPANVTLAGQSAGGWSVCVHLASPRSRRLFHRAVVQSGVCTLPLPSAAEAEEQGMRVARALGCDAAPDVAACLRAVPPPALLAVLPPDPSIFLLEGDFGLWRPSVDGLVLEEQVAEALRAGRSAPVPLVAGANRDEGTFFVLAAHEYRGAPLSDVLYPERLRVVFGDELAEDVAARYPLVRFASPAAALAEAVGDGLLSCPTLEAARLHAAHAPAFVYQLEHRGLPYVLGEPALLAPGAFHSAEVPLVFGVPEADAFTADAELLSGVLRDAWAAFAASGDPARGGRPWPRHEPGGDEAYLALDVPPTVRTRPRGDACAFWRTLDLRRAPLL